MLAGEAEAANVNDWIDRWHQRSGTEPLHEYLGMTEADYGAWVANPSTWNLNRVIAAYDPAERRQGADRPRGPENRDATKPPHGRPAVGQSDMLPRPLANRANCTFSLATTSLRPPTAP